MNSVQILGRCGTDPELRHTPSGKPVTELNLAVDEGWGENKKTAWIGVTIWGVTAELAVRALRKGDRVVIQGRLSQEEWEDKQTGKKQRKTKVTCEQMHLVEPRKNDDDRPAQAPAPRQAAQQQPQDDDEEGDIPF